MARPTGAIAAAIGTAIFTIVMAGSARADPAGDFAARYVAAVNSDSEADFLALFHSTTRECMDQTNVDYFENVLKTDLNRTIPDDYRLSVATVGASDKLLLEGMVNYEPQPSHVIQFEIDDGADRGTTLLRYVIDVGGVWHMVIACPTPEFLAWAAEVRTQVLARQERARKLAAQVYPSLLADVKVLVFRGQRVEAIKLYAESAGVGLVMANAVVRLITGAED